MANKVGKVTIRSNGNSRYIGTVLKLDTSFKNSGLLLFGVHANDGEIDPIVSMTTASGEVIELSNVFINIIAKL